MYHVMTLNSISPKGVERLPASLFQLTDDPAEAAGILVRSQNMQEMELPEGLLAVARAGAGTNNIPIDRCTAQGIAVFNTPGANANAVKELTIAGLVLASRNIAPALSWVSTLAGEGEAVGKLVEKGKSRFVGPELAGKRLGVIGLGAIGVKVANTATHLGLEVFGYDPYISVESAWNLSRNVVHCVNLNDLYRQCDLITIHVPVTRETTGFINNEAIAQMKPGVRIVNFARGELVDEGAILSATHSGRVACYVCDFPSAALIGQPGVVTLPHLGASTPESEENCAVMAAEELKDYLLNGNIRNSVNLPDVELPRVGGSRVCVLHRNIPGMLSGITGAVSDASLNIENLVNKGRGEIAYTMLDVSGSVGGAVVNRLKGLAGSIRVRII
ncbi:MAG TPA: phosphoglycerate dehydrogenase [Candidatus Pygmaiobacter gallistercoris]|nr:phosphoglycerate dehydrogenase [Candidatus Pygmaiobacter gallistercoris]